MLPTLGQIGPFVVFTFTLLIDLGIAIGLAWLAQPAAQAGDEPQAAHRLDAGLAATFGALVGARLAYVFSNWAYFGNHLGETVRIWEGGLAWPGAVAGGALGLWAYCRFRGGSFWGMADALALPGLLVAALAWLGCAASGCAPGVQVEPGALPAWFAVDWPDNYGISALRWPTQAVGAAWSLVLLLGLWLVRDRPIVPVGGRALLAAAGVALGGLVLSFSRGDAMPHLAGLRLDALASGVVLGVALAALWTRWAARKA